VSDTLVFRPIGVVRSPYTREEGTPIQPALATGVEGAIELDPAFAPSLADLDGFERVWVLYVFDRARAYRSQVVPYLDEHPRGLFATRAPCRPNPIGMSSLRLLAVSGATLRVADLDILDGTPVLDIKPYVPRFDAFPGARAGWLEAGGSGERHADGRFTHSGDADND
jgi:tRNA-Thr(GGU) m(6)t(6)A37 methyltransferase TsaA